jgi:lipopolysaccharide/colanic/teichoic acid biosynthesis glycosyltransferase
MYMRAPDQVYTLTRKGDPRVTPVGRIIRRLHLDELPQLFNILKGDMSFVGPRPECPAIADDYAQVVPEFKYRLKVKGGLTGYAQVYGKYNTTPYDKLKLDLTYIENYSFLLDLKLIALTFKVMFHPDNTEGIESWQTTAAVTQPETDKEGVEV